MARQSLLLTLVALASLSLVGCSGKSGDSCRAESDCESALICCAAGSPASGGEFGVCQAECLSGSNDLDAGSDAGTDAAVSDAGSDAGQDAGTDAGTSDDAGADASEDDAGP